MLRGVTVSELLARLAVTRPGALRSIPFTPIIQAVSPPPALSWIPPASGHSCYGRWHGNGRTIPGRRCRYEAGSAGGRRGVVRGAMLGGGSVQAPPDGRGRLLPSRSLCGLSQSEAAAGGLRFWKCAASTCCQRASSRCAGLSPACVALTVSRSEG